MRPPSSDQFAAALSWLGLALLTYLLYLVVQPFLVPLGWACVLAVMVYPAHARLSRRIGASRAAAVSTVTVALLLIAPAVAVAIAFAHEMVDITARMQGTLADGRFSAAQGAWQSLVDRLPFITANVDLASMLADGLRRAATSIMAASSSLVTNVVVFFLDLALSLFATFFLLREATPLMRVIRRLLPMAPAEREIFITRTGELIAAGVTSSVIVAGLQGLFGGLAFAIVGLSAPVFWGVVMAFACLLPFGAWVVWLPASIFLATSGSMTKALLLLGMGAGVVSMVDNVVRPMLLSERVQMNGLVIFVSLLGGLNVFGLLGIVLGPIVVVTAMALLTSYVNAGQDTDTTKLAG